MKQHIFAVALALCLLISPQSMASAWQGVPLAREEVLTKGAADELAADDSTIPSPAQVYETIIALKDQEGYKEETTWTNDEPYSDSKGPLNGTNIAAVGCVAFAFVLSDAAFDSLPARIYAAGAFSFEDIKVGDILQVDNDAHTVIVLEVSDAGVVVAEGNYNGKVHWGRAISKDDVMNSASHYITRYPENYIPPDDPTANEIIKSGTLEGGLTWSLTKAGTMTISGSGAMPDFGGPADLPWTDCSAQIRKVVIENGVTGIGAGAFWGCGVLSVEISASVTTIGNSAFRGSSLISVTIPSGVETIGDSAFQACENLSSVTISEGVRTIGQNAFRSCVSLTAIALPASIEEVGAAAFLQCQALTSAVFAAGSKRVQLGDNMFMGCYYLSRVTLPKSIDRIGEGMFQKCIMLAGVEIPQGAGSIEASAFASSGVTTVIIPDSVTTIGTAAFSACPLKDIYFTGTEAQWNSIGKLGDTASKLSEATIHYEYSQTPTPPEETTPPETVPPEETTPPETVPPEETTPSETVPPEETTPSETVPPEETTPSKPETPTDPTIPSNPTTPPGPTTPSNPTTPPGPTAPPNPTTPPDSETPPAPAAPSGSTSAPAQTTRPNLTTASGRGTTQALTPVPAPTQSAAVPFIDGRAGKEGWEVIKEEAAKASEGKRINVNMNGASLVPGEVIDSIKGQKVTISFDMGKGIVWLVDGENVTADHANDVDLSVQVGTSAIPEDIINAVSGDRQATQLSLAHSGDFGYSAVLMIDVGKENAELYANLFYYNESAGELTFVTASQVNKEGIAELIFTHASDYVLVVDNHVMEKSAGDDVSAEDSHPQTTEAESPETDESEAAIEVSNDAQSQQEGNSMNFMWLFLIGAAALAVVGTILYRIQKKGKK